MCSSGHLELGKVILGIETQEDLTFTVVVHGATVLSTIIVFWRELWRLLRGAVRVKLNEETNYLLKIVVSMIPVLLSEFFWKIGLKLFQRKPAVCRVDAIGYCRFAGVCPFLSP